MESVTESNQATVTMKPSQHSDEHKEDPVRINGEVNGSYDEEMEVCEDTAIINKLVSQSQSNGEVSEEDSSRVPSHENGVEKMDLDFDEQSNNSETGNNNGESSDGFRDSGENRVRTIDNNEDSVNNLEENERSESSNHNEEGGEDTCVSEGRSEGYMPGEEEDYTEEDGVDYTHGEYMHEDAGTQDEDEDCMQEDMFSHQEVALAHEVVALGHDEDPLTHEEDPLTNEEDPLPHEEDLSTQEEGASIHEDALIHEESAGDSQDKQELPISEMEHVPKEIKELRKDSIEITVVRPGGSTQKEDQGDSCEAINMSVTKKDIKEEKDIDEMETITLDSSACDDPLQDSIMKTPEKDDDDSVIEISPEKSNSKKKKSQPINITPRRSSRNLNKNKSYADKDIYIDEIDRKSDDDIEEVVPTDPLADDTKKSPRKTTIVVNDTKRLVEIAAGSKQSRGGKKEPTLVIIDTNSILSGKGAVPIAQTNLPQMTITPTPPRSAFSMLPVNVPATNTPYHQKHPKTVPQPAPQPKPAILPSLTDDMYVVEAPSFIVPYVYEKPPVTALKEYVDDMEKTIKEQRERGKLEEKERHKRKKEKAEEEKAAKESSEASAEKQEGEGSEKGDVDSKSDSGKTDSEKDKCEDKEKEKEVSDKSDTETDDELKDSDEEKKGESTDKTKKKSESYFENPLGKFFMQIGVNLVQEYVQTDLLRNQKRKRERDGKNCPPEVHMAISSLLRTLECSKENNGPFKLELKKCNLCSFKTESELVMAHHLETPHMRNYVYRCNFCTMEVRSPHDILFHMEAVHNVRGRLERAPAFHQCPNCPFEDNQKGKLSRHLLSCAKKYKPERNQEPPLDWECPAKIPRVRSSRPGLNMAGAMYPPVGAAAARVQNSLGASRMPSPPTSSVHSLLAHRGRGRPPTLLVNRYIGDVRSQAHKQISQSRPGMVYRPSGSNSQPQVLLPTPYQISNTQLFQNKVGGAATAKLLQQPSISITPLPRQSSTSSSSPSSGSGNMSGGSQLSQISTKPGRPPGSSKATFVICEICDGYIKDLEQLRNHMQWIHKVKIHPKMIYNRPPLNCQKCQFRFFTDQGLERHLLGSHGLVTSSMQEAANKGKDGGRCPVCGRVYQWKLLNHVARDHNMSLKPAHLSYKCTVCTATFGMYKQFENHVYSAHSVVAKRVMEKKPATPQPSTSSSTQSESLLKPLKINDEITIIPQPARAKTKPPPAPQKTNKV